MAQSGRLVHPSDLLRSDTNEFSAPRNLDLGLGDFDCGLNAAPWLNDCLKLHKYAKVEVFIILATALGCMQGIAFSYFKDTSEIWSMFFNLDSIGLRTHLVEWIIHCGDLFAGFFGVLISYWGNRHRPTWMGGLAVIHAMAAIILIIPEIYHPKFTNFNIGDMSNNTILCLKNGTGSKIKMNIQNEIDSEKSYIAVGVFIFYQLFYSFAIVCYTSLGISYIDDHVKYKNSATYICILLVGKECGKQIGIYLSFIPVLFNRYTFFSFSWLTVAVCIFILGSLIAMFSKVLPLKIALDGATSLLDITEDIAQEEATKSDGYFTQTKQLITNKPLMLNVMSASVISIAVVNFDILQSEYFRSRVGFSKISSYGKQTQFAADHITQMVKMFAMIASTLIITKVKPNGRMLSIWLCFIYFLTALLFLISIFVRCSNSVHYTRKYCNVNCNCGEKEVFEPVCDVERKITYYSPCYAGCTAQNEMNFTSCSCLFGNAVTPGYCDADECNLTWSFSQILNVLRTGALASGRIIHILMLLKSVPITHKAIGLGLYFGFVDVFPYAPFKILYDLLRDHFCLSKDYQGFCTIYDKNFVYYTHSITIALVVVSAIIALFLTRAVAGINLYFNADEDKQTERLNGGSSLRLNNDGRYERNTGQVSSWSTNYTEEDIDEGLREVEAEIVDGRPSSERRMAETWL